MIDAEIKRIHDILESAEISERRMKALSPIIENVAFMKEKLDDTREKIAGSSVVIPYDNGGGQTGIRENPLYKGYESLWKSYLNGMDRRLSTLPADAVKTMADEMEKESPVSVVELGSTKPKRA